MDAFLILENGTVFKGKRFGYDGNAVGELVFNTAMTGYLENLADPRYYGQFLCQTFPLVGNYGVIPEDIYKGNVHLNAYIVREWCQVPSNFRSEGNLDTFLRDIKVPGLYDIDTRSLTRIIRDLGPMNALLSNSPEPYKKSLLKSYKIKKGVETTSRKEPLTLYPDASHNETSKTDTPEPYRKIAVLDFGAAGNIADRLTAKGCEVTLLPFNTQYEDLLSYSALVLSPGPGNPNDYPELCNLTERLIESGLPLLGLGFGHQLLALAQGGQVSPLKHGHRGSNQPVRELSGGRMRITAQNHGYAVTQIPENAVTTYENVFDNSCEGLLYKDLPLISLQFFPDTSGGPHDMDYIYDEFLRLGGTK